MKKLIQKNNLDFLHIYSWLKPSEKIKIIQATVQTSNNNLHKNNLYLNDIQFYLTLFLLQKPYIKISKKSNASFKIRPNIPIGTKNHMHKYNLNIFYNRFITSILPYIKQKPKYTSNKINNYKYHLLVSYGWKQITPVNISYNINPYKLGGAHIQFLIKSPVNKLPFLYFT